jgi:GntR family histidine utilization transcriptional repressor
VKKTVKRSASLKDRIRSDIEAKIFSGKWPPGHRIPNEQKLASTYSCARMTVNKVLSDLAAAGIVERKRKAGTFVGRPAIQSAVLRIPEIQAEVETLGYAYQYELLQIERRRATKSDRELMGLTANHDVIEFRCRHWADKKPFAYEHRFLNLTAVPEAGNLDFHVTSPGAWLLRHVPWTKAEHSISAQDADPDTAAMLALAKSAACLVVQRRTWRAGDMITHVRTIFPGGLYRLNAHFTPTNG